MRRAQRRQAARHGGRRTEPLPPIASQENDRPRLGQQIKALVDLGYASATVNFSTWTGRPFLHLDCLFVRDNCRSLGVGVRLLGAVRTHAAEREFGEIQWQTPDWNEDAIRFYRREGASFLPKARFFLPVR